jgi:putative membrane protein
VLARETLRRFDDQPSLHNSGESMSIRDSAKQHREEVTIPANEHIGHAAAEIARLHVSRPARGAPLLLVLIAPLSAHAHVEAQVPTSFWGDWPLQSWVIVPALLTVVCYAVGAHRLRRRDSAPTRAARWAFYTGLATVFVALQTPLDALAEHLFSVHQVQHVLMRTLAPMLLMLAVPAPALIAGLPELARRHILAPLLHLAGLRASFAFLGQPFVATFVYVATLYAWQVPGWHDAALLNERLHDWMHVTMFASGMFFFWSVFDPQPAPWGVPFSRRILMLGAAIFANLPIGALTTLKGSVWYPAYDHLGRAFHETALADELLGGLVLWIPASMMGVVAVLLVLHRWGRAEQRLEERRVRGVMPRSLTGDTSATRLGWNLAWVPLVVFASLLGFALALRYGSLDGHGAASTSLQRAASKQSEPPGDPAAHRRSERLLKSPTAFK